MKGSAERSSADNGFWRGNYPTQQPGWLEVMGNEVFPKVCQETFGGEKLDG